MYVMIRELLPRIFGRIAIPDKVEESLLEDAFGEIGIVMNCLGNKCENTRSVPGRYVTSMLVDRDSAYLEAVTDKVGRCGNERCASGSYGRVLLEAANVTCAVTMVDPEVVAVISGENIASS